MLILRVFVPVCRIGEGDSEGSRRPKIVLAHPHILTIAAAGRALRRIQSVAVTRRAPSHIVGTQASWSILFGHAVAVEVPVRSDLSHAAGNGARVAACSVR